ncbi:hypothetical protein E3A20_25290 [Planctomyces bekefii]|uniref:Lipoprotein n=1 Tax=Planctomyces bekefii TaxID=1653850 RepID=A0A5C6M2G2_9PLAN|nr:hypothetical protein E3A20_25290 [Planctomyces bekefii]
MEEMKVKVSKTKCTFGSVLFAVVCGGLSACYLEVSEDPEGGHSSSGSMGRIRRDADDEILPTSLRGHGEVCEESRSADQKLTWHCYKKDNFTWRTSCKSDSCQAVHVYTHYMLQDYLGESRVVQVEAFDNQYFQGAPASQVRIAHFNAKQGEWKEVDLFVEPGEYYLRAFLTTDRDQAVPYSLGGMELKGDEPFGVLGALSGPELIRVAPSHQDPYPDPVHIYLDQLFKKPGSEPETNAHLRINFTVADQSRIVDGRRVIIRLQKSRDLAERPAAEYSLASELLLIQGRVGRAEFLSPSLNPGVYFVFAFIDENLNNSYDGGELAALASEGGVPKPITIVQERTLTLPLALTSETVVESP